MSFKRDLRYGARMLRRDGAEPASAVLLLGLSMALCAMAFSLVDALLLSPLPVAASERLLRIFSAAAKEPEGHSPLAPGDVEDLRDSLSSCDGVAAFWYTAVAVDDGDAARVAMAELVSDDYFPLLGVRAWIGSTIESATEATESAEAGARPLAMLSHLAWQRRFAAEAGIVGRSIRINGHPFTVVGVAPPGFTGLTRAISPELWLPLESPRLWQRRADEPDPSEAPAPVDRRQRFLWGVARLAPQSTLDEARAEATALAGRLAREYPETNRDRTILVEPANRVRILPQVDAVIADGSILLLGAVALVLLIACSNVTNLLLARGLARGTEFATRRALGASSSAIARQLLAESALLALASVAAGLLLAWVACRGLASLRTPLPVDVALGVRVDLRGLAFSGALAALVVPLIGALPAFSAQRRDLTAGLRPGSLTDSAAGGRRRLARLLVCAQITLSSVLVSACALSLESLARAGHLDLGFVPQGAAVVTLAPGLQGYPPQRARQLERRLLERARALPGAVAAGFTSHLPLSVERQMERVAPRATASPEEWREVDAAAVGPGYAEAMGIELLAGRFFEDGDEASSARVVVVDETLAERLWPGAAAVGQRISLAGDQATWEIIGVARVGRYRTLGEPSRAFLYRPLWLDRPLIDRAGEVTSGTRTMVLRATGDDAVQVAALRRLVSEIDDRLAVGRASTLEEAIGAARFLPRALATVATAVAAFGILFAAVGLYGLMTYLTRRRRREVAIRLALGATSGAVIGLLWRDARTIVGVGLGTGLLIAGIVADALAPLLVGIEPQHLPSFAAAGVAVALVTVAASMVPALRVSRLRPGSALASPE